MPVKTTNNMKQFVKKVQQANEKALTEIAGVVLSRAKFYVPLDTGDLQNSDFRQVFADREDRLVAVMGYTAFYALPLHGTESYSPIWRPRAPGERGKPLQAGYNADATPQFLSRGVEESEANIQTIIKANNTL